MEPIRYLSAFRRRWWVVVLATLVGGAAAWATSTQVDAGLPRSTAKLYSATAVLWNLGSSSSSRGSITDLNTLSQIATLPDVAAIAAKTLDYQGDPSSLSSRVTATAGKKAVFLSITGYGPDAESAKEVASAFSNGLIVYLADLKKQQIDQKQHLLRVQIAALERQGDPSGVIPSLRASLNSLSLDRAVPISLSVIQQPTAEEIGTGGFQAPQSRTARVLLGLLLGFAAGLALVLVMERFDTRIRTRQSAQDAFGVPVLAEIPPVARRRRHGVVTTTYPMSRAADAFRLLTVGLARQGVVNVHDVSNGDGQPAESVPTSMTILVTSPEPGDGKTTVAANIAAAFAETGKRVLALSCDLRRPSIDRLFGVPDTPGVADVLASMNGEAMLDRSAVLPYVALPTFSMVAVMPGGNTPNNPGELLRSPKMQVLLASARRFADIVILDCAPMVVASDVAPLLAQTDVVLVVARGGKTRADVAARTTHLLESLGATIAGVVLNDAQESSKAMAKRRFYDAPRRARHASRMEPVAVSEGARDEQKDMWVGLG